VQDRGVIRNIIFDWSGTLVDDLPAVLAGTNYAFRKAGVPEMSLETFRAEFSLPFPQFYARVAPNVPLADMEKWFHEDFRREQHLVVTLPYAKEFLTFCRSHGIRMFILSSIHAEYYKKHMAADGLDQFIERPYLAIRDKRMKIGELLLENGIQAAETLFVGDMQHDIDTAKHGGVHSCAVLTGYNGLDQLRASKPDLIVEHLGELKRILEQSHFEMGNLAAVWSLMEHPISTVGALVFDGAGRVLMIHTQKWSGLWGIPGGKIKYGETAIDALRREIREETNLEVDDIQFIAAQDCIHCKEFYHDAHFIVLSYTCRAVNPSEVKLNSEGLEYRWVTPSEACALGLNTPSRMLLETVSTVFRHS
jgi:phosphoglycolate phosphatase